MLVVLESPNKVKKVSSYLKGATVRASFGHVKDLPSRELGVDRETYEPRFQFRTPQAKKTVAELKKLARDRDVVLATDPDREGYAIATHLYQELKGVAASIRRAEIREITPDHVRAQVSKAVPFTATNFGLYEAFLGRRVGDRLVGYILSPEACSALSGRYSVGRVQSPALRLVVEREREIRAFKPVTYYVVSVQCEKGGVSFWAVHDVKEKVLDREKAQAVLERVKGARTALVTYVETRRVKKRPYPPFTTSTLQQAASAVLKMAPERTMALAQALFEAGFITYHRTDSTRLADEFVAGVRGFIEGEWGRRYLAPSPRSFKSKKTQADAHEAIRPTRVEPLDETLKAIGEEGLSRDHERLYELIWKRAVACQMADAEYDRTVVKLDVAGEPFKAAGQVEVFQGWRVLFGHEKADDDGPEEQDENVSLPVLEKGETVAKTGERLQEKQTQPPPRYTEGSLVKALEKLGIGRPSTYATITSVLKGVPRNGKPTRTPYVKVVKGKLMPTPEGESLIEYLERNHPWVIDYELTARMEAFLDRVEEGKAKWEDFVRGLHKKMGCSWPGENGGRPRKVSPRMREYALSIARERGDDISAILEDPEKLSAYIEENKDSVVSEKMARFARELAERTGIPLTDETLSSRKALSRWIDKAKKKAQSEAPLSPKQAAILEREGMSELLDNPAAARRWLDQYFKGLKKKGKGRGKGARKRARPR